MTGIVEFYDRHARDFDRERDRSLFERGWLDDMTHRLPPAARILDLGCGMAEPVAAYLIGQGRKVTGVDAAPAMLALCRERFPDAEWIEADMRTLELGRRFDAIVAWDSFFHLTPAEQRGMFGTFARHIAPGGMLLFTSGPEAGEKTGELWDEPLYHASLSPAEYRRRLNECGFAVVRHKAEDPDCGGHTVWLAKAS
jgi:SAM-dependent methyltransferase